MKWTCDYHNMKQFVKAHDTDAGYDLYAAEGVVIEAGNRAVIKTGLHVDIPRGYVGIIKPRSGLSLLAGTDTLAGVVDAGYHGEVLVVLTAQEDLVIDMEDKIAQMVILPIYDGEAERVGSVEDFGTSERGDNGFGSTGMH